MPPGTGSFSISHVMYRTEDAWRHEGTRSQGRICTHALGHAMIPIAFSVCSSVVSLGVRFDFAALL
jgi:hypothetical protein